jgi:hypothetical protein
MSMTLLDAKEFDSEKESKRNKRIILIVVVVVILAGLIWWFRYWPEERIAGRFFDALQKQDFKTAYGIWMHDPDWQQHPGEHPKYSFNDFYTDWGPGGEWGTIKTQKVYGASTCPGPNSGVVVDVIVNDRVQHAQVWVEKSDHSLSYPPCELIFH